MKAKRNNWTTTLCCLNLIVFLQLLYVFQLLLWSCCWLSVHIVMLMCCQWRAIDVLSMMCCHVVTSTSRLLCYNIEDISIHKESMHSSSLSVYRLVAALPSKDITSTYLYFNTWVAAIVWLLHWGWLLQMECFWWYWWLCRVIVDP